MIGRGWSILFANHDPPIFPTCFSFFFIISYVWT